MTKAADIMAAATPGPWYGWHGDDDHCMNAYAVTSELCDHEFTSDDGHPRHVVALTLLQQPRLASLGHAEGATLTDRDVNAMRWQENARAIVTAVNLFPLYEAVREAADDIAGSGHIDTDGETGDEFCHWCESSPDYSGRETRERHRDGCPFPALRAALDALQAAEDAL